MEFGTTPFGRPQVEVGGVKMDKATKAMLDYFEKDDKREWFKEEQQREPGVSQEKTPPKHFQDFYLAAKARIGPGLSYMCREGP